MSHEHIKQSHANRVRRGRGRGRRREQPQASSLWQEMATGSVVGVVACLAFASLLGASPPMLAFAMAAGWCAGAVVGIQVWIATARLPDDPVLPPAPGQERQDTRRR